MVASPSSPVGAGASVRPRLAIVGVLPGFIDTDSMQIMTGPLYETMKKVEVETHPLREAASPEAAAEAMAPMCLPEARWLNGQERPE